MRTFFSLIFTISVIGFWCYGIATLNQTHPGWAGAITVATIIAGCIVASKKND